MLHKYIKMIIPESCRVPDNAETGQGSGKKPDNDGVAWTTASAQRPAENEALGCVHGIIVPCGMSRSVISKYKQEL